MRKFIVFILAIGMIAGLSNAAFAVSVTVDSNNDGGKNYWNGFSQSFDAGSYTLTVADGAWGDWWGAEGWFWSLNIYDENTSTTYSLGNNTSYGSASEALAAASSGGPVAIDLASSGNLWFYVADSSGWNNYGAVTANVAFAEGTPIVPEPISSILFIAGGMVLTGRRYLKRKKRTNT